MRLNDPRFSIRDRSGQLLHEKGGISALAAADTRRYIKANTPTSGRPKPCLARGANETLHERPHGCDIGSTADR